MIPKGELKRRARQKNHLVNILSDGKLDEFEEVHIITLKQWVLEQAYDQAWETCTFPSNVNNIVSNLLVTTLSKGREFVTVSPDSILVGINSSIIDDDAIDRAIILLSKLNDFRTSQTLKFGEEVNIYGSE